MLILITYDVSTEDKAGRQRLHHVAKSCVRHGQRVQNSVFECNLDYGELLRFKAELKGLIDPKVDSLRIYSLGNHYENKVEHIGAKPSLDLEGTLVF